MDFYPYILSIHIIFVVCWMAGLFYIVRLFVYHTEAQDKPEPERAILSKQFEIMERRLWNVIAVPSMFIVIIAGLSMTWMKPVWLQMGWLPIKLGFVLLLIGYHHVCQAKIKEMRKGIFKWTSTQLRLWNEGATVLLFAIVFLAVTKNAINWIYGVLGLVGLAVVLMVAVKIYKKYRTKE